MSEKITKDEIAGVLGGLMKSFAADAEKGARENPGFAEICKQVESAKGDPEDFYFLGPVRQFEDLLETAIKDATKLVNPCAIEIWMDWNFFESHLNTICRSFYGFACCADKSRSILRSYIKHADAGTTPEFDASKYYNPATGTGKEWMQMVLGIRSLRFGQYIPFATALAALMESHRAANAAQP